MEKIKWEMAKKNGLAERYRGDEISKRIADKYNVNDQLALLMDKDSKPDEWNAYQDFRAKVKDEVDAEITVFESKEV